MARKSTITPKTVAANLIKERTAYLQTNPDAINYTLRNESIKAVQILILEVAETANMNVDEMKKRLQVATSRTEYGKVPSLFNLLANVANWPIDKDGSPAGIADAKLAIEALLVDIIEPLEDLRQAKGYHTFVSDNYEIVEGIEPDFDEYEMLCQLIASSLRIPVVDIKLSDSAWDKTEQKAEAKAIKDMEDIQAELEEHRKLHGDNYDPVAAELQELQDVKDEIADNKVLAKLRAEVTAEVKASMSA